MLAWNRASSADGRGGETFYLGEATFIVRATNRYGATSPRSISSPTTFTVMGCRLQVAFPQRDGHFDPRLVESLLDAVPDIA